MKGSAPSEKGAGKTRRVSHRRELAVVTLAAVASISGVGGLLAAGQQGSLPVESANAPASSTITPPTQPKTHQRTLAVTQASYHDDEGDEVEGFDDGQAIVRPASKAKHARRDARVAWSSTSHAAPSAVSQGSAPVN